MLQVEKKWVQVLVTILRVGGSSGWVINWNHNNQWSKGDLKGNWQDKCTTKIRNQLHI